MMTAIPANTRPLAGPAPRLKAPAGATDCHMHFYLPGFQAQPGGPPVAETATVENYAIVQHRLGLARLVVVQPNAYQFDNGSTLMGLDLVGKARARAVIALDPETSIAELQRLDDRGVRGARIMNLPGGAVKLDGLKPVERLAREVGWSLLVQFNGNEMLQHLDLLQSIEADFVIDHLGKFMPPVASDAPQIEAILRLLDRGNCWLKICGAYEVSLTGGPDYSDVAGLAKRLIAHAPERLIWGTNWPHVAVPRSAYPDDARQLDLLLDWASPDTRQRILIDNPAELYGF